jgi:uncharacterized protein (DUF488 family)
VSNPQRIWTIGHSTHSSHEFLSLLAAHEVQAIADVRRFPASRRQPQFNEAILRGWLAKAKIGYRWFEALGGRRTPSPDSANTAWKNASFRGYADYMETEEFAAAFSELLRFAARQRTAIMCAESVWWSCHRALISDALTFRGIEVIHILDETQTKVHPYTSAASIIDGRLSYEAPDPQRPLPL